MCASILLIATDEHASYIGILGEGVLRGEAIAAVAGLTPAAGAMGVEASLRVAVGDDGTIGLGSGLGKILERLGVVVACGHGVGRHGQACIFMCTTFICTTLNHAWQMVLFIHVQVIMI